ncbi:MAG: alpha/beta fold hydrolase [Myxococcales bacterium]|nr:alpha/beta fold hydrolase [Myxococcales bacterium]
MKRIAAVATTKAAGLFSTARGHFWTVAPLASDRLSPLPLAAGTPFRQRFVDPRVGPIEVTGALHRPPGGGDDRLVVALHGVGGDIDSHYVKRATLAALDQGIACLRLNMRGADMSGSDFYHAGLSADLHHALESPVLAGFRRIAMIGYSLGGHLVLRYALDRPDARLGAIAAVCAPLDLAQASRDIDHPARSPYRRHVMTSLRAMARATHRRRGLPIPLEGIGRIRRFRDWDSLIVAPRFGFCDADDYYARASVAPALGRLAHPTLFVGAPHDPMVLPRAIAPALRSASKAIQSHWLPRGGHVGFPADVDLGVDAPPGLEPQAIAWLIERLR